MLSLDILCSLYRGSTQPVIASSRVEDTIHHTTESSLCFDLLGWLLAFALEAGLMAFETWSTDSCTISTVVGGIGTLCQVNHDNTIINI